MHTWQESDRMWRCGSPLATSGLLLDVRKLRTKDQRRCSLYGKCKVTERIGTERHIENYINYKYLNSKYFALLDKTYVPHLYISLSYFLASSISITHVTFFKE
jgi:hypothetical protein